MVNIIKNFLVVLKESGATKDTTDSFKTAPKRAIQKTAETTDGLIGNKLQMR